MVGAVVELYHENAQMTKRQEVLLETCSSNGVMFAPGDLVLALTCGMGSGGLRVGRYVGMNTSGGAVVDYICKVDVLRDACGNKYDFAAQQRKVKYPRSYDYIKSQWLSPGYDVEFALYKAAVNSYNEQVKERQSAFTWRSESVLRRTHLQNNDMYPVTLIDDFVILEKTLEGNSVG